MGGEEKERRGEGERVAAIACEQNKSMKKLIFKKFHFRMRRATAATAAAEAQLRQTRQPKKKLLTEPKTGFPGKLH